MATVYVKVGNRIRKLRSSKKITQEELAATAKIDYSYLNQIENGKRNPSAKILSKIARALGVKLSHLVDFK